MPSIDEDNAENPFPAELLNDFFEVTWVNIFKYQKLSLFASIQRTGLEAFIVDNNHFIQSQHLNASGAIYSKYAIGNLKTSLLHSFLASFIRFVFSNTLLPSNTLLFNNNVSLTGGWKKLHPGSFQRSISFRNCIECQSLCYNCLSIDAYITTG